MMGDIASRRIIRPAPSMVGSMPSMCRAGNADNMANCCLQKVPATVGFWPFGDVARISLTGRSWLATVVGNIVRY